MLYISYFPRNFVYAVCFGMVIFGFPVLLLKDAPIQPNLIGWLLILIVCK